MRRERSVAMNDAPAAALAKPRFKQKAKRLVIYDGNLRVRVARVESALTRVTAIAKKHDGFIEKSSTSNYNSRASMIIRVPVEKFYEAVRELGELGTLLQKDIKAADITRQFQDTSMRLNAAKRLRSRLYLLLKSDVKQKEKVKILKELSRLNEQIEKMESRVKAMQRKAALATITLRLESLLDPSKSPRFASPFPWITALKPDGRSLKEPARLEYKTPAGFFEARDKFADGDTDYLLLSPDGVKIRTGQLENYPEGPLSFWETVLENEWKRRGYKLLHQRDLSGQETGRVFFLNIDDGLRNYYYSVTLIVKDDRINVIETVFNNEAVFKKQRSVIDKFLNNIRVSTWQNIWPF